MCTTTDLTLKGVSINVEYHYARNGISSCIHLNCRSVVMHSVLSACMPPIIMPMESAKRELTMKVVQ